MAQTKKTTGTKKMAETKDVTVTEEKEVGFGELELKIAKPTLNSDKTISISGNFSELGGKIQAVVDRYKGTVLTEDNVDYVKTLKNQFVSLRTGIERERKEYKKVYIKPANDLVDCMCDELQKIVAEGENALGAQLDAYDQRRKDNLTIVLKDYVHEFATKYGLRDEYEAQIVLIDKYYNRTQKEEDTIADIEKQAMELSKKQSEYDSGIALIKAECEGTGFVPDTYIRELEYKSAMEVILEIKADKLKREELKAQSDRGETIKIGEELEKELETAKNLDSSDERTRLLRVTYRSEQASLMKEFFTKNNIKYEFVKTDF